MTKSWDFWDTLVTRCVPYSTDIFEIVENLSGINGFARIRQETEFRLRKGVGETTLDAIYRNLPYPDSLKKTLCALELEIELKLASPIVCNSKLFKPSDIVISDMYLDRNTFSKIGAKCGITLNAKNLYLSSDRLMTKHSGQLFDWVLNERNLKTHIGDNYHSDVKVPRHKGIQSIHFHGADLNKLEKKYINSSKESKYIAGVLRAARLTCDESQPVRIKEWEVYSQVVSPVLVSFVEWLLDDALGRGIKTLFFLSRDGQILYKIAINLAKNRDLPIQLKYLYGSRQALHIPGHLDISESKEWLLENTAVLTLRIIAHRAGLSPECFSNIAKKYIAADLDENLTSCHRKALLNIIQDNVFLELFSAASFEKFNLAKKYLIQEGVISDSADLSAIVDVGWNGRIQRSLDNIIIKSGYTSSSLHGYYFALKDNCVYSDGERVHGFVYDPFSSSKKQGKWLIRYGAVLEFFLVADHPSVTEYFEDELGSLMPVFSSELDESIEDIAFRHYAIISFVEKYIQLGSTIGFDYFNLQAQSLDHLRDFFENPSKEHASSLINYSHSDQQTGGHLKSLVTKVDLISFLFRRPRGHVGLWAEGSFAASGLSYSYKFMYWILTNLRIVKSLLKVCMSAGSRVSGR